jgi:acetyl esterase/lipase
MAAETESAADTNATQELPRAATTLPGNSPAATGRISPTQANVRYGPHERNLFDFWQAESSSPTPLVVYIHGGGFRGGSKESISQSVLRELLDSRISVAAINYRLIDSAKLPAAHHDARSAVQLLRHEAQQRNVDPDRFAAFGGSAGAQICMWLAFHDDMADSASDNPVFRESSRLTCVATFGGQTTMDFDWWRQWIPGYDRPHRDPREVFGDLPRTEQKSLIHELAAIDLLSADDPPIFMQYSMSPDDAVPEDAARARNWKVHHVVFGMKLKDRIDQLGLEAHLMYPGSTSQYDSIAEFFRAKLLAGNSDEDEVRALTDRAGGR